MKVKRIFGLLMATMMALSLMTVPQTASAATKILYEASNISGAKSINLDGIGFTTGGKYQIDATVVPTATSGWHWAYIDIEGSSFSVHDWNLATYIDGGYYFNGSWKSSVSSNVTTPALSEGITFNMVWDTASGTVTVSSGNSGWTFPAQTWNPGVLPEGGTFGSFKVGGSGATVKSVSVSVLDYESDAMYEAENISGKKAVNLDSIGFVNGGKYQIDATVVPTSTSGWHWAYIDIEGSSFSVHDWNLATYIDGGYYFNGSWKSSVGSNVMTPALSEGINFTMVWDTISGTVTVSSGNSGWIFDTQTWTPGILPDGGKFGNFVVGGSGATVKSIAIRNIAEEDKNTVVDYAETDINGTKPVNLDELGFRNDEKYIIEATVVPEEATGWPWAYITLEKSSFSVHGWGLASFINDGYYFNGSWKSSVSTNVTVPALTEGIKFKMVWDTKNGTAAITAGNSGWTFDEQTWTSGTLPEGGKFGNFVVGGISCTVKSISIKEIMDITASVEGYGKVTGGGTYMANDTVTLKATPLVGCKFEGWYKNDELVSEDAEFVFAATESCEYVAKFSGTPQHNIFNLNGYEYNEDFAEMTADTYETMPWVDSSKATFDDENNRIVINTGSALALDLDELGIDEKGTYEIRIGMKGGDETPSVTGHAWNAYFDGGQELLAEYWETAGGIAGNTEQRANRIFGVWKAIYNYSKDGWDMVIRWNTSTGEMTVTTMDVTNMWSTSGTKTITKYTKGNFPNLYLNAGFETLYIDYLSVKYVPADMDVTSSDIKIYANDVEQKSWNGLSPKTNKIVIDFGAILQNAEGITLTDSEGASVAFTGEQDKASYVLNISDGLKESAVYTLLIDTTVSDIMGETVKKPFIAKLKTSKNVLGGKAAVVDADGKATNVMSEAVGLKLDYVNNTGDAQDINVIENYYNAGVLVATKVKKYTKDASVTEDTITHTFTKPADAYTSMKVMVWNGFGYMETISEFITLN